MKIVNVGCGATPTKGALNFDNSFTVTLANNRLLLYLAKSTGYVDVLTSHFVEVIKKYGIRKADATLLPLDDNSVDVIYSSHMIEHMGYDEVLAFLRNSYKQLKKGGIIRLATPDFQLKVNQYLQTGDADLFFKSTLLGRVAYRGTLRQRIKLFFFGDRSHLYLYDAHSITKLLESAGFSEVTILEVGKTTIPFQTSINYSERSEESLYVEAKKV